MTCNARYYTSDSFASDVVIENLYGTESISAEDKPDMSHRGYEGHVNRFDWHFEDLHAPEEMEFFMEDV